MPTLIVKTDVTDSEGNSKFSAESKIEGQDDNSIDALAIPAMDCLEVDVNAGSRAWLKFFSVKIMLPEKKEDGKETPMPKIVFTTSGRDKDCKEVKGGEFTLTDSIAFYGKALDTLFGANQKSLDKVNFHNLATEPATIQIFYVRDVAAAKPNDE